MMHPMGAMPTIPPSHTGSRTPGPSALLPCAIPIWSFPTPVQNVPLTLGSCNAAAAPCGLSMSHPTFADV